MDVTSDSSSLQPKPHPEESNEPLILRDHLAINRTTLANERTLLAYVRTALALFFTGFSALHLPGFHPNPLFGGLVYELVGWLFIAAGAAVLVAGYARYRQFRARILTRPAGEADNGDRGKRPVAFAAIAAYTNLLDRTLAPTEKGAPCDS